MAKARSVALAMGSSAYSVEIIRKLLINLIKASWVHPYVIMPDQVVEHSSIIIPPMQDVNVEFPHVTTDGLLDRFCRQMISQRISITPSLPIRCALLGNSSALFLKILGISFDYDTDDGLIALQPLSNDFLTISSTHLSTAGLTMYRLAFPSAVIHLYPSKDVDMLVNNIESIVKILFKADLGGGVLQTVER